MKKVFFFALLLSGLLGLPITASYALEPGCSPEVMDLLNRQADAVRARNRAYEREVLNREESTLYLTCFDQALALSARLGYIFSDNVPSNPPPANTVIFSSPLAYKDWGMTHNLVVDLNDVVTPMLDKHLQNFLPPWNPANNALHNLANQIQPFIDQINNFLAHEDDVPATSPAAWVQLVANVDAFVHGFPNYPWDQLQARMTDYLNYKQMVIDGANAIMAHRQQNLQPILDNMKNAVMGYNFNCTRLDDLWNNQDDAQVQASQYYPPEGKYYPLSPYYSLEDVLGGHPAGATPDFLNELNYDSAILSQAMADLSGPLSQPGNSPVWPPAPNFPAFPNSATSDEIVSMMHN